MKWLLNTESELSTPHSHFVHALIEEFNTIYGSSNGEELFTVFTYSGTAKRMRIRQPVMGVLLSVLIILSGCGGPAVSLSIDGNVSESNETYILEGELVDGSQGDAVELKNVTVYLYDANQSLLNRTTIRSMEGRSQRFVVAAPERPKYIVIDSPSIWKYNGVSVPYLVYRNGEYRSRVIGDRSELPVSLSADSS